LHIQPVANGGRAVQAYQSGRNHRCGRVQEDPEELVGVKERLGVQSQIAIPLTIGSSRRGVVMICSTQPDYFTQGDETFAQSAVHWVGLVAHRAELVSDIERTAVEQGRKTAADEVIAVLAHDLRNYVSPIVSRLFLLRHRAEKAGDAEALSHVEAAQRSVAGLSSLISNLLDVTRLDEGLFALELQPVDLVALVKESGAALSTAEHEILVRASEPVLVAADPLRLRQCVDNLLANAMGHSPRDAPVNVFISKAKARNRDQGQVEIVDEGPGIPQEMLPRIFERFVSGRSSQGGMGLGLYLARRVATSHGGDLSADSRPGKGARFVLRIPCYPEAASE
jgi:two-component system OmpR family sensor kinase